MKNISIRAKITLCFAASMLVIAALMTGSVLGISYAVIQRNVKNDLVRMVEDNVGEITYFAEESQLRLDSNYDIFILYNDGFLEIDDDYLDVVNGIYTALYEGEVLLYGENPIADKVREVSCEDGRLHTIPVAGTTYYVYDRKLTAEGMDRLWLRGIVSEHYGAAKISPAIRLTLLLIPALMALAVAGGWLIAGHLLRPLRGMSEAAERIRAGNDLSGRVASGKSNDEISRLGGTLNDMLDRLEKSFKAEQQFTADVSHELRTPVSVILSQCEYSLSSPREAQEDREAFEVILRQSRRMSRMIGDMLQLSRLERKTQAPRYAPLDFSALVQGICEDMALTREKNITLTADIEPDLWLNADAEMLARLLSNLIGNAYKYGRENGHIRVSLRRREETGEAELCVADDGIGMTPEELPHIWDRFYRADAARSIQGSGLGLSLVHEIAQLHAARLQVQSSPGEGSRFYVIFDVQK